MVKVSQATKDKLDALAKLRGVSLIDLLDELLETALEKERKYIEEQIALQRRYEQQKTPPKPRK